jgi:hypothetical protein
VDGVSVKNTKVGILDTTASSQKLSTLNLHFTSNSVQGYIAVLKFSTAFHKTVEL